MAVTLYHQPEDASYTPAYEAQYLTDATAVQDGWTGYGDRALATYQPTSYRKYIDRDTGYWYYENRRTGERHWDRPIQGVSDFRPRPHSAEEANVDTTREKRQRLERETRRHHMAKRRAQLEKQRLEDRANADATERQRVEVLWDEAEEHAVRKGGGELVLAWRQVPGISEKHVFDFHERHGTRLVSLRLIGVGLTEVPDDIGRHLWSLKSLSLSSNTLQEIPGGLCNLTGLTELNLVRNKLVALPDRIGSLLRLRHLSVAGNRLGSIPPSFGNLLRLERVVLDCNRIRKLPETLGRMKCRRFNVSNNKLAGLPHCLKDMPRLAVLSAVNNGLRTLPADIGDSRSITALHLGSNRLTQLPDSICRLQTLKVLWLDHNFIAGLPTRFHELTGLQKLLMERNDMIFPPTEVVQDGCERVRKWCARRLHDRTMARQHTIVMAVQTVLKQVADRGLADPCHFEADVQVGETGDDHFYALIYDRFWDTMLPALEREWEKGEAASKGAVTSFEYARDEVDMVLLEYRDPTGRVLRTKTQMFRRCSCADANGRRRVCVPPKVGWMCERKATLIKHDIILEREQEERRRQQLEKEDIEFRVSLARRLVKENSEAIEGKKAYTSKAIKMAEELVKKKQLGEYTSEAEAMKAHRRKLVEKKFSKVKDALSKDREHHMADLKRKLTVLEKELKELRGWAKEQKEAQISKVMASMETLPEDAKLQEIDKELEAEVDKMDAKAATASAQTMKKVMNKTVKRGDKEFQDIVDEMVIDLVRQDMDAAGEGARRKAEKEHQVFRRIMAMWIGLGMRESFAEWKTWTKRRIKQRRKDVRKEVREAWHRYEAEGVVGVMAEWKMSFWEERYDQYNDSLLWVHKETGETRTERPTVEEFIPDGYEMPKPPSKRLEDLSSSGSSRKTSSSNSGSSSDSTPKAGRRSARQSKRSRGSGSRSSGWSFTSSTTISVDESGSRASSDGSSSSSNTLSPGAGHTSDSSGSEDTGSESHDGSSDADDGASSASSTSNSGSGSPSSSSGSDSGIASGTTSNSGQEDGSASDITSATTPSEDGNNYKASDALVISNGGGAAENRLLKRASTTGTTTGMSGTTENTETADVSKDSGQSLALQVIAGPSHGSPVGERALVPSPEGGLRESKRADTSRRQGRQGKPKSPGLAVFLKDTAGSAHEAATKLVQASDGYSSQPSSLRTEKTLERQQQWEVDHARVRARRLRENALQEYKREEKIRRETAVLEETKRASGEAPPLSVNEIMSSVGWSADEEYSMERLGGFAKQAMAKMDELGMDTSVLLEQYGNKSL